MKAWDRSARLDAWLVGLGVAVGMLGVLAAVGVRGERTAARPGDTPLGWRETAWPFEVYPWWPSKAFVCPPTACRVGLTLYVRAKIGFCNCKTGVADDEELERIGDFALLAQRHAPTADGHPIAVAWMKGRSRPYSYEGQAVGGTAARAGKALLIGYNDRCDAIVATAVVDRGEPIAAEKAVLDMLGSPRLMRWAEVTLGL